LLGLSLSTLRLGRITPKRGKIRLIPSVEGFSLEFAVLNPLAFGFYTIYSLSGFIDFDIGAG